MYPRGYICGYKWVHQESWVHVGNYVGKSRGLQLFMPFGAKGTVTGCSLAAPPAHDMNLTMSTSMIVSHASMREQHLRPGATQEAMFWKCSVVFHAQHLELQLRCKSTGLVASRTGLVAMYIDEHTRSHPDAHATLGTSA